MEIIKLDHTQYGLEEQKAKQISDMFKPMLDKMVELEGKANEVLSMPMGPDAYAKARELRLEYVRTRTGTATIHKKLKEFYLQGGRFVDGWKNAQLMAAQGMEERLSEIENHEKIERQKQIQKYDIEVIPENLGEMDKTTWDNYLTGTKINYTKKKEAEKKAEKERAEIERIQSLTTIRREETLKYSDFIPEYKTLDLGRIDDKEYHKILQDASNAFESKKKKDEENKKELERLRKEARGKEEIRKKEKAENDRKLLEERRAKEDAERKLKEKREEEIRKAEEEEQKQQAILNADDSTKVKSLVDDLSFIAGKYSFKSKKNQEMYRGVVVLLGKIIQYINTK